MKILIEFEPGDPEKNLLDEIHHLQFLRGDAPEHLISHESIYAAGLVRLHAGLEEEHVAAVEADSRR